MPLQHRQRVAKIKNVIKKRKEQAKKFYTEIKSWQRLVTSEIDGISMSATTISDNMKNCQGQIVKYEQLVSEFTTLQQTVEQLKGAKSASENKKLKEAEKKLKAKDTEASDCASELEILLEGCKAQMEGARNWSENLPPIGGG